MPKHKKVFTEPRMDSKRKKIARQFETEEQREKRLSNIRKEVKKNRENLTEEERTHIIEEVRSRMRPLRNRQSTL